MQAGAVPRNQKGEANRADAEHLLLHSNLEWLLFKCLNDCKGHEPGTQLFRKRTPDSEILVTSASEPGASGLAD